MPHRLCKTTSHSHRFFPLCFPSTRDVAYVQDKRDEVVRLRCERAGALCVLQEDGKHRVFELGPVVFDTLAQVGLLQGSALRRL